MSTPYCNRKRGHLLISSPLSPLKRVNATNSDPDFVPENWRSDAKKNKRSETGLEATPALNESLSPDFSRLLNMLKEMHKTNQDGFEKLSKKVDGLLKRVSNVESYIIAAKDVNQPRGLPLKTSLCFEFGFGLEFFKEDEANFLWMGQEIHDDINAYVALLDGGSTKVTLVIRRMIERLVGARNLCYFQFSDATYDRPDVRPNFAMKDPVGDGIIKFVLKKMAKTMLLAMRRGDLNDDQFKGYEAVLKESDGCLTWAMEQVNSAGSDHQKKNVVMEKKSIYWSLLNKEIEKPNPKWTLFDECNDGTMKIIQFKADPECSSIFKRMLEVEKVLIAAKKDDTLANLKTKYDNFGRLLE